MRRLHDTVAVCALLCVLATAPAAFGAPASPAAATVPPAEAPRKAPPAPGTPLEAAAPQAPVSIPVPQIVAKAEEVTKLLRELDALAAPAPAITAEEFRLRSGGDVVALCATPAADDQLGRLHEFNLCVKLVKFDLSHTAVTDAGLDKLVNVILLTDLNLVGSKVTPAGVERLKKRRQNDVKGGAAPQVVLGPRRPSCACTMLVEAIDGRIGDRMKPLERIVLVVGHTRRVPDEQCEEDEGTWGQRGSALQQLFE